MSGEQILQILLSPSRGLAATIVAVHGGAGLCAGALVAGAPGILLGLLIATLGVAAAWDRALLRGRKSVHAMLIASDGSLSLELANAGRLTLRLSPRRYVSRLVVILSDRRSMHRTIVVTRAMADPEAFRALRLWALWGRVPNSGHRNSLAQVHGSERTICQGDCQ